jgi:class 3 adenylate cyclase/tetratricopeptide (TPR) repeat protein
MPDSPPRLVQVEQFWRLAEIESMSRASVSALAGPAWCRDLATVHHLEIAHEAEKAAPLLEAARASVPAGPWDHIAELLALRIAVRRGTGPGIADALPKLRALMEGLGPEEMQTLARAHHLAGVADIRLGRLEAAETALTRALELVDEEAPSKLWLIDTLAQLWTGQGAWVEATRTLRALVTMRAAKNDTTGVAISGGSLARLLLQLDMPEEAATTARHALDQLPEGTSALTRLRLRSLLATAVLDGSPPPEATTLEHERVALEELLTAAADAGNHYLRGYAALTLARVSIAQKDDAAARRWLDFAATFFTLPGQVTLLRYHEAMIDPQATARDGWLDEFERACASMDNVSEAEVLTRLTVARRAAQGRDDATTKRQLTRAYARVEESNNAMWVRWVDEAARQLDPEQLSERVAQRFSGRSRGQMARTIREDVTIIFADLVNFTPRTLELAPEEVMQTVRGLFELGVPLMTKHQVSPISYMGDGLLALCQGEGHATRGLDFACELVARAGRVSRVRRVLGDAWALDLRAGVASGVVVLGTLGTLFKTDFAAIGLTTNLAARLQSAALPGEVMCWGDTARAAGRNAAPETVHLKGFEKLGTIEACRFRVYEIH